MLGFSLLSSVHAAESLVNCTDGGPWPCTEDGCPAPRLTCDILSRDGLCTFAFSQFFDQPPPEMAQTTVREVCPRACGRCGHAAPDACNMDRLDAQSLGAEALAQALVDATSPVVVAGAMESWRERGSSTCWEYGNLASKHGGLTVKVILEGGRFRGEATEEVEMEMAEYSRAMRNATLPDGAYVFTDVQDELPCDELFRTVPRAYATKGRLILSMGSWGNGRPFHAHGPALFGLISGVKRWFIRRPNATFAWQTYEVARDDLRESDELPDGWAAQVWQCAQRPGELLWVPDLMQVRNLALSPAYHDLP